MGRSTGGWLPAVLMLMLAVPGLPLLAQAPATDVAAAESSTARMQLDRFSDQLLALAGEFRQEVFNTDGSLREESTGSVALQSPHRFRWHYRTPYEQLVIADGSHVWLYDVDLEQVTVRRQADAEAQSPLTVLTDPGSLDERFAVTELPARDGLAWLRLEPFEPDSGFHYAKLGLAGDELRRLRMEDSLGGVTVIHFPQWQRNPALPPAQFQFLPPDGVDLIGDIDSLVERRPLLD
ncbi:MAG: outer membrane lipoprotein carrier protein LolA [Xanthomonadales bacterium]|nr:outer membrane lipoprotein carrier protein LolA [Xanthomonadales bacterium]